MIFNLVHGLVISKAKASLGLDCCEEFVYGAAPLKKTTRDYFANIDMPLLNVFGMSETCGATSIQRYNKFDLENCGYTMPGVDMKIDQPDSNGEGELCMKGRNTMLGYLNNEEACLKTFDSEGYVHSGDRGVIDKNGWLRITGRIKELIITAGGENVAPVPIEDIFKEEFSPCSNIMLLGEGQRFISALITFKVGINMKNGMPSNELLPEVVNYFK